MAQQKVTRQELHAHQKRRIQRERTTALKVWIGILALFGVLAVVQAILAGSAMAIATGAFVIICAVGLWYWQRWAYFGTLGAAAIVALVALAAVFNSSGQATVSNLGTLAAALVAAGVTVALVQPRLAMFR